MSFIAQVEKKSTKPTFFFFIFVFIFESFLSSFDFILFYSELSFERALFSIKLEMYIEKS